MPKMICLCILLIYFKVISKKGGHYCPRLPYVENPEFIITQILLSRLNNIQNNCTSNMMSMLSDT